MRENLSFKALQRSDYYFLRVLPNGERNYIRFFAVGNDKKVEGFWIYKNISFRMTTHFSRWPSENEWKIISKDIYEHEKILVSHIWEMKKEDWEKLWKETFLQ